MIRRAFLLWLALLPAIVLAQASGAPETTLAGINIESATIADVIQLYGQPEAIYAVPDPYPAGTKQYKWGRLTLTLAVLTEPAASGSRITAIQIEGDGDNTSASSTGRGLKLGEKEQAIKKIYGVESLGPDIRLNWKRTALLIYLKKSRITRMELLLQSSQTGQ